MRHQVSSTTDYSTRPVSACISASIAHVDDSKTPSEFNNRLQYKTCECVYPSVHSTGRCRQRMPSVDQWRHISHDATTTLSRRDVSSPTNSSRSTAVSSKTTNHMMSTTFHLVVIASHPSYVVINPYLWLISGTVYHSTSHPRSHCQSSTVASRHISSDAASHDYVVVPEKWHRHFWTR